MMKAGKLFVLLAFLGTSQFSNAGFLDIVGSFVRLPRALIRLGIDQTDITAFINYKAAFHREYSNEKSEIASMLSFVQNLRLINMQNQKYRQGTSSYQDSVSSLTDIDHDKFILTHTGYIGTVSARSIKDVQFPPTKIPAYLNYAEKGLVTGVDYQGYCKACWAFSAVGALEGQLAKKTGKLIKLSEQDLIDCDRDKKNGNWGCNGGNMHLAFEGIKEKGGISPYNIYKYRGKDNYTCQFNPRKSVGTVIDYVELPSGNETQLLLALINVGPISVAIDASEPSFQHYKGGIYNHPGCSKQPNHAVLLVGFGTDKNYGPYWILKNSWGKAWGENGFFRLPRNNQNVCGIAVDASYPVV